MIGTSQRAAVLVDPLTTRVQSAPMPAPSSGEVRVRLQGCGICASNLSVWEGRPWFKYPRDAGSPGHEGWGIVDAIGEGVADIEVGERVAMISGHAYAEYDIAPRSAVVRLPREFDQLVFPGEPLGCVMNIFERSDIRAGQKVAIVGAGFLGLLLTQLATRAGADVVVLSRREYALGVAKSMGARETFDTADAYAAKEGALRAAGGKGYDRVIEAVGMQSTLDLASSLTAEYAKLIIAGYHQDGLRQINLQEWNWRAIDVVNAHERSVERYVGGVQRAVDAILQGRMDPFGLFTHAVSLESLDHGFEMTRDRPDGFMKAVVTMGGRA
ncbi:MAG TPA: zinc-binding dehydrogenase [Steroidobacteraceae bacterium]|nr:zinc-binding dehydrogenase [Steroidobacteraceae bacterium]